MPDTTNKLLTVREVAQQLQMSASWVYKAVARNEMPYLNIGASVRFDPRDVGGIGVVGGDVFGRAFSPGRRAPLLGHQ